MGTRYIKPILKWVGGKRKILPAIEGVLPREYGTYYEPFLGGGAVFFRISPTKAVVSDLNSELITTYSAVRDNPDEVIRKLRYLAYRTSSDYYYYIRGFDRTETWKEADPTMIAARMIFLNKTGFNGLYRVNKEGYFNTPWGRKESYIPDTENIKAVSEYLRKGDYRIVVMPFQESLEIPVSGDFVYLDPPYVSASATSDFTSYTADGFSMEMQKKLVDCLKSLDNRGVMFLLSNSAAARPLYKDWKITDVQAPRAIAASWQSRGAAQEILVRNY